MAAPQDEPSLIVQADMIGSDVTLPPHPPAEVDLKLHPAATQANLAYGFAKNEHQIETGFEDSLCLLAHSDALAAGAQQRASENIPRPFSP